MLNIQKISHLAASLGVSVEELRKVAEHSADFCEQLLLIDPRRPEKRRVVLNVVRPLRTLQSRLYTRILLPKLKPSGANHGGVRGRSIKTNALEHKESSFIWKADIRDFYPSIHHSRIYRLFTGQLKCSPDVARLCTKLCTHGGHVALGLITSPILADQVLATVDSRVMASCKGMGIRYSRFVDDITISGPYDLASSGIKGTVDSILRCEGFQLHPLKIESGQTDEISITGIRVRRSGRLDVSGIYVDQLREYLRAAMCLSQGGIIDQSSYLTKTQILGRIHFVAWVNIARKKPLLSQFRRINWKSHKDNAISQGLVKISKATRRLK